MRIRFKKWARPELEASKFYIDEPEKYKGKWNSLFNSPAPLHIELGCGKGSFISQLACKNSNINYIAIRSHNIKLCKDEKEENVFEVIIENIVENPFDYTLYIKSINSNKAGLIHFTISKEEMVFDINEKIKVKFEPQYLFTFKN